MFIHHDRLGMEAKGFKDQQLHCPHHLEQTFTVLLISVGSLVTMHDCPASAFISSH